MSIKAKALFFNFICFGILYFIFRFLIGSGFDLSRMLNIILSALWASILSPKFLVKEAQLWVKFPFISQPKKL